MERIENNSSNVIETMERAVKNRSITIQYIHIVLQKYITVNSSGYSESVLLPWDFIITGVDCIS